MRRALLSVTGPRKDGEIELGNLALTRLVSHIESRLTVVVKWAAGVAALIIVATVAFAGVSVYQDVERGHDQCISSNRSRGEIRDAFAGLYDAFVTASGGSAEAVEFKKTQMARLAKNLPNRDC